MPNLNRVMLMGNLTRDPELRYTPSNTAVVNLGLAINRRWRNQNNEPQEETTFVDCEAWGRTAELLNQYLRKGRPVYLEGRLKLDQWQDKEGNNRSKLKVVVETFQFIDSKQDGPGGPGPGSLPDEMGGPPPQQSGQRFSGPRTNPAPRQAPSNQPPPTHEPVEEDNIPF